MISVSRLIDLLDKPALLYWANKIGLQGIPIKEYYKRTQQEGTEKHNKIELYLVKGVPFDGCEILDDSLKGYDILGVEYDVDNKYICGRIDLILEKDGIKYVVDFKRNKNIYLKTKLQLCCYKYLYGADKIAYINYDNFKLQVLDIDTEKYWSIIKNLYKINETLKSLNEKL